MKLKKGSAAAKAYMAKIRAKRNTKKVGEVAKKDTLKVFYVGFKNRKIREKIEAKSAKDAIKEYQNRLKPIYGSVPATWLTANKKNTLGATKKVGAVVLNEEEKQFIREEAEESGQGYNYRAKVLFGNTILLKEKKGTPIKKWYFDFDVAKKIAEILNKKQTVKKVGSTLKLKTNEKRLGALPNDLKTRSKNYHKDTKSHNVNIRVISGVDIKTTKGKQNLQNVKLFISIVSSLGNLKTSGTKRSLNMWVENSIKAEELLNRINKSILPALYLSNLNDAILTFNYWKVK